MLTYLFVALSSLVVFNIFFRTGLNFLSEMRGLPPMCFLGTDATLWIIHHIHSVKSRTEAVQLGQVRHMWLRGGKDG